MSAESILRALATLGGSLRALTLPPDVGDGPAPDGVAPTGLIMGFHGIPGVWTPIQGYGGLVRFLSRDRFRLTLDRPDAVDAPPGSLVLFAYDWRLSNRWTAKRLKSTVEHALTRWRESAPERRDAKVVFICHSMGGLVARWYVEKDGGAEVARSLIALGTPHRGAMSALEQLVNGVRRGPAPLRLDLTSFARSLPSSYELLPEYACIQGSNGGADAAPMKTTECELPGLNSKRVAAGMTFHEELDNSETSTSCPLLPVVGIGQPTSTTGCLEDERVVPVPTIEGRDLMGDGTVPRLAARPKRLAELDPSIKAVGEGHGALPAHRSVLDQLDFVLTAEETVYRATERTGGEADEEKVLGVSVPDLHEAGEPVEVSVRADRPWRLQVAAVDESGREVARELVRFDASVNESGRRLGTASFERLDPGGYSLVVSAPDDPGGLEVSPVHATTLVWDQA